MLLIKCIAGLTADSSIKIAYIIMAATKKKVEP